MKVTFGCQENISFCATTKPMVSCINSQSMQSFSMRSDHSRLRLFSFIAGILILLFPAVAMASTPPVQPSLAFDISNPSPAPGASTMLTITWTGYPTYNTAPEQILVEIFSQPDGTRLGVLPVPLAKVMPDPANERIYEATITGVTLPAGTYKLIATDPLSGATSQNALTISPHPDSSGNLLRQFESEQQFVLGTGVFTIILLYLLVIFVKPRAAE